MNLRITLSSFKKERRFQWYCVTVTDPLEGEWKTLTLIAPRGKRPGWALESLHGRSADKYLHYTVS